MNTARNHLELSRRLLYRALGGGALAVSCLACLAGSALASPHAGWSRTAIAREPENCPYHAPVTAFDAHGALWVACQLRGDAGGIFVGRLTRGYRVLYPYLIPGTVGLPPESMSLAINRAGIAVLAWGYRTAIAGPYAVGVAAATWRVGHAPGSATILAPAGMQGGPPGVAVNASGIAVAAFGDTQGVSAARFSHGHLLGVTRLTTTNEAVSSIELLAGKGGRFFASWATTGPNSYRTGSERLGVGSASANAAGVFSHRSQSLVVQPPSPSLGPVSPEAIGVEAHADARGDQVLSWTTGSATAGQAGGQVFVASHRPGEPFTAPEPVGVEPFGGIEAKSAMGPSGRFTVIWTGPHQIMATLGDAGRAPTRQQPMVTRGAVPGLQLAVTSGGVTVAICSTNRARPASQRTPSRWPRALTGCISRPRARFLVWAPASATAGSHD